MPSVITTKGSQMGAVITLLLLIAVVGGRFWYELRRFDELSVRASEIHERDFASTAKPLDASYYF